MEEAIVVLPVEEPLIDGVVSVGELLNTASPVPVSSKRAEASQAELIKVD